MAARKLSSRDKARELASGQEFSVGGDETLAQSFVVATDEDLGKAAELAHGEEEVLPDQTVVGGAYIANNIWVGADGKPLAPETVDVARDLHEKRQDDANARNEALLSAMTQTPQPGQQFVAVPVTARRPNASTEE